jgi:hypothetical protein
MAVSPRVSTVATVRLDDTLQRQVQQFISAQGFSTVTEGLRALITRGLFVENKPRGKLSESAWVASYIESKGKIQSALYKTMTGPRMRQLIDEAFREAFAQGDGRSIDIPAE